MWTAIKDFFTDWYSIFHFLTLIAVILLNIYQAHTYKMETVRCLTVTVLVYIMTYIWMLFLFWVENGFSFWGGQNFVRVFIWVPLLAWPASKLVKTDWKTTCDIAAPSLTLAMGVGKFGCVSAGCCQGYPCDWGIYNSFFKRTCFPVQIFEAVTALIITAYLVYYVKKRNYPADGRAYAIMLILFGSTRFFWEFFRDNDKLFWGISNLAIHAFVMFVAGCVAYFYVIPHMEKKQNQKISSEA